MGASISCIQSPINQDFINEMQKIIGELIAALPISYAVSRYL
jgi:hypothetical protein